MQGPKRKRAIHKDCTELSVMRKKPAFGCYSIY